MKFLLPLLLAAAAEACTNILVTPGASVENHAMIAYNADSASLFGSLYHYPAATHAPGSLRQIYDWDSGVYLGSIPESPSTYNVVGNVNEHGLSIGETTFGGIASLQHQDGAVMDYGSLIWVALQRCKTAREAIETLKDLMETHGYASEGESFSIADSNEVWIMEIIGKGNFGKGAVWVALRLPDGTVSSHANQARITTFPRDDPDNALYAPDVVDFARGIKLPGADVEDEDFSFSDVYDPVTFEGARFCEGRVWSFFSSVLGEEFENEYSDYVSGKNLTNRMPLWVTPSAKISVTDVFGHMRNHFEGTSLDFRYDVGGGAYEAPVRFRPLTWQYDGAQYVNERPIGTMQTGWNFVSASRGNVPKALSGIIFFGVDDSATTARVPLYGSATRIPLSFAGAGPQDGVVSPMMKFDFNHAFYVFNLVSNFAYSRWSDVYPVVLARVEAVEADLIRALREIDSRAISVYQNVGEVQAVELVTSWGVEAGDKLTDNWKQFFGELFVRFRDGYDIQADDKSTSCGCSVGGNGYSKSTYQRIAESTGDQYFEKNLTPEEPAHLKAEKEGKRPVSKLSLKQL